MSNGHAAPYGRGGPAGRRPRARFMAGVAAVLVSVWAAGLARFAALMPERVADETSRTDAIVVLTGGSGRLEAGLDLLARGRAEKLFVSGVYQGIDVQRLLQIARRGRDGIESRIAVGTAANTRGNALETAEWMRKEKFRSLRLVTGAYHMPRSLLEFGAAMPEVSAIPHPVFPEHVKADWWAWPGTLFLIAGEYNKTLFVWTRHRLMELALWIGRGGKNQDRSRSS